MSSQATNQPGGLLDGKIAVITGAAAEYDLSLWITKARALTGAWGTPAEHRATVLDALVRGT